jgi:hypothetical protein
VGVLFYFASWWFIHDDEAEEDAPKQERPASTPE